MTRRSRRRSEAASEANLGHRRESRDRRGPTYTGPRPESTGRRREPLTRERWIAMACAAIAVATSGVAVVASIAPHGWSPSVLVRMAPNEPMARVAAEAQPDFAFVSPDAHYDGVYFYA